MRKTRPTNPKLEDRGGIPSIFGTFLVILAGVLLYSDKVINYFSIQIDYQFKYYVSLDTFLWSVSVTVSPLLIIASHWFRPKKWSLIFPLTAYSIQLIYLMSDEHWLHKDFFWWYSLAFLLFFYLGIHFFSRILRNLVFTIAPIKEKIRYVMNLMMVQAIDKGHIKDEDRYEEEIIYPALKKLDE